MCDQNLDADSYHLFQNESYSQTETTKTDIFPVKNCRVIIGSGAKPTDTIQTANLISAFSNCHSTWNWCDFVLLPTKTGWFKKHDSKMEHRHTVQTVTYHTRLLHKRDASCSHTDSAWSPQRRLTFSQLLFVHTEPSSAVLSRTDVSIHTSCRVLRNKKRRDGTHHDI